METKIEECENMISSLMERTHILEKTIEKLLTERVELLERKMTLLKEKQDDERIEIYEHLQFMNFSQKIKDIENEIRNIKYINSQKSLLQRL